MQTTLYMLTETSEFMMSFVLVTEKNNCIVIDGGRPLDMPLLKEYVAGRHSYTGSSSWRNGTG